MPSLKIKSGSDNLSLSIVICTKDRYIDIVDAVKSILSQTILPDELIIVDQTLGDSVEKVVNNFLKKRGHKKILLRYIHDPEIPGLTSARNIGIHKSTGDIVLFLDDDVILERDFIAQIMETYKKYPYIGGVGGSIINYRAGFIKQLLFKAFYVGPFKDERQEVYWNLNKYESLDIIRTSKIGGGLMSFKRDLLRDIKFDENFIGYSFGEDFEFSYRFSLSHKLAINPNARLYHKRSSQNKGDLKKITEAMVCAKYYFFKKDLNRNLYTWMCFIWANIGDFISAILTSISKKITTPLLGVLSGYWKIFNGLRECDFIVLERYPRRVMGLKHSKK